MGLILACTIIIMVQNHKLNIHRDMLVTVFAELLLVRILGVYWECELKHFRMDVHGGIEHKVIT
jgi:uncharacterized membrane protein YeiH